MFNTYVLPLNYLLFYFRFLLNICMKPFKQYLIERLSNPTDLGIFDKVISDLREVIEDYQSPKPKYKAPIDKSGIGFEYVINFNGTPFENLGKRKLWVNIVNHGDPHYWDGSQIITLNVEFLIEEYPRLISLEHELIHYFQDLSKRKVAKPWGTAPKSSYKKYQNAVMHKNLPQEYLSNLTDFFNLIQLEQQRHHLTRETILNYLTFKNNSLSQVGSFKLIRRRIATLLKGNPEVGKRYIKKLYTSL